MAEISADFRPARMEEIYEIACKIWMWGSCGLSSTYHRSSRFLQGAAAGLHHLS